MPNKIVSVRLQSVVYGGDKLGRNLQLDFDVNGMKTSLRANLEGGATRSFSELLYRFQNTNNAVQFPIAATVTELDPKQNDVGSAAMKVIVDLNGQSNQALGTLEVKVKGSGGDKGKTAIFTLSFAASLEEVNRFVPDIGTGWLVVQLEPSKERVSLPYSVAVSYTRTENKREHFTILEGVNAGKAASVSLDDKGNTRFLLTDPRTAGVKLRFTKSTGILEVVGTALKYPNTVSEKNPIPAGDWDIEIPDAPHRYGAPYENTARRSKSWFRLGHAGDRYLHTGSVSLGCVTVKEVARWDELYAQMVRARKSDGQSVGVLEVRDK